MAKALLTAGTRLRFVACVSGELSQYLSLGHAATLVMKTRWKTFLKTDPTFIGIAPQPPALRAPPHTPDNIARFVEQAKDNLSKNWDAAGTMFRKALDTALKRKFPDITGTLHERIKKAAETHALTPDLAEWADQIRLDGNNAAHEERPFRREEAERLAVFTELILQYLFTLPGMLKKAQEKRAIIIQRI